MNLIDASAVYAGAAAAQAVYYGATKVWSFSRWRQVGSTLTGSADDRLGVAVAASGNFFAAGGIFSFGTNNGYVVVYNTLDFAMRGSPIYGAAGSSLGRAVSLSATGDIVAASTMTGFVRVFEWTGTAWAQRGADITQTSGTPDASNAWFGISISLSSSGDVLAIGAPNGLSYSGYTEIYAWTGTAWTLRGSRIVSEVSGDRSGHSVSLSADGTRVAIGARYSDTGGADSGHARVFEWTGSAWDQIGDSIPGAAAGDEAGSSVSLNSSGTRVAIGAHYHDQPALNAGQVRVFEDVGGSWVQMGQSITGEAIDDGAGWAVSLNPSGDVVAVGGRFNDGSGSNSGHVRTFEWNGSAWIQRGLDIDGTNAGDRFGEAVAIGQNFLIGGAPYNAGNGTNSGHVRVFEYVPGWEPPAFSPASIAGLRLWLDASVGLYDAATGGNPVTTAAPVLRWEDQSGNGFHATAVSATAPSLALSQVNSLPGILFPSTGGKYFNLPNPLPAGGTGATIFVVTQPTQTGSDGGPLVGMIGSNTEFWSDSHYPYRNSNIEDGFAATTRKTITPLPSGMFTWHLYNVVSGAGDWRYLFNGSVYFSTTTNTYNGASFSGRTPKIGYSDSRGTWYFRGTIAEIVIYNSALSETDRQTVTEYLRAKYNLWSA